MIVQAEREKAEVQRKEAPEEDDRGRQKYMSFLDELEAKYGNQCSVKRRLRRTTGGGKST